MAIYSKIGPQYSGNPKEDHIISLASDSANYWISFISDPVTVVVFIIWEALIIRTSILAVSISYGAGLLGWSLLEYVFHRWIYHKGRTRAHAGHKMHHESPKKLIAMPWFVVTALFACLWYIFAYRLQFHYISGFMAGLLTGFVLYGACHHIHHHFNFKNPRYRKLRAHHFIHHQFPNVNFGVTSRVWDHVFGTTYRKQFKKAALAERAFNSLREEPHV